ncbi:hypothetical protein FRACYDRAFT_235257 [Fragilariopsis cylindrus CCMP1102]|uniref:J domain-containing protein n=1 Tax=Fragilariopsis cylindrus CCMP1102 TaxID=635003 RepID=A0A1E7FTZ6_9STRA|nr:hypothetical protein FRACYDRAFT_235257 [Fragilariopsis cylindrus CCMP1102]|eukprot:OEU21631.1 hypothetical protein FRACYDRAFT_235257 [Fragilariopsis cylindrus CCMP1102]
MQYPTRNRSSRRQKSYNNLVDVEHNNEKNVATTTKCSKEETPLSSSRILFNRRQGITSTNMISRFKSRISLNRRQQQRITPRKKQPVINSKKRGEVVSNSNNNMNRNVNSGDINSPVLSSSSQTCCSTSSGSSSSSKSTSELELQSNKLVEGSSSQQKPPPPSPQQKEEEKGQALPRSYVDAILKVYGTSRRSSSSSSLSSSLYVADNDDVDLYRDVLQISSKASNREIQMAYIREGRSMLITTNNNDKDDGTTTSSARSTELLDDRETKLKFIALSMAHEILSTPSLKEIYDTTQRQQSGGSSDDDAVCCEISKSDSTSKAKAKEKQVSPVKVLRASSYNTNVGRDIIFGRSSSLPSSLLLSNGIARSSTGLSALTSSSSSSSSIRWKDHVEEMKFIGHPNEHEKWIRKAAKSEEKEKQKQQQQQLEKHTKTERTNTSSSSSTSTSQCCTSIPEELESRLVSMDADVGGERLFVKDFWDTFEDSLDTVTSVVLVGPNVLNSGITDGIEVYEEAAGTVKSFDVFTT